MPKIDTITEQKIKDAASIVDVVGDYVTLRKSGVNYKALCPFHTDHSPSMSVSPKRNIYKCFVCGAGGNPVDFLMNHPDTRLTYPDALRYLAKKYNIWIDDTPQQDARWMHVKPATPRKPEDIKPLDTLYIDRSIVKRTTDLREQNQFVTWLKSLPWGDERRKRIDPTLWQYCVGHFRKDGRTCWWQIDEQGRPHTAKLMMYGPDGKRNRDRWDHPGWAHNYLPYDRDKYQMQQCLFGLHLIDRYPDRPVNIVESEKTAIICTIAFGQEQGLWLACGGLQNMKEQELQPLIDRQRNIYLWPDKDGADDWRLFADNIDYPNLHVWPKFLTDNWLPEDGPKADIADVILRLLRDPASADRQQERAVEWIDGTPFLDPDELADPRVHEWRQKIRLADWLRRHPDQPLPSPDIEGVSSVGDLVMQNPLIQTLIDPNNP